MKLGEECADMPPLLDFLLKEGFLQLEVILLAQKSCHATVSIFERANGTAFCTHASNVEAVFLQHLLEAFCGTCWNNSDQPEHWSQHLDMVLRSSLQPLVFTCTVFHTDAP
jgi:hypothetical protein